MRKFKIYEIDHSNYRKVLVYEQERDFYGKKIYGDYKKFESYKYLMSQGMLIGDENFIYGKIAVELSHQEFIVFIEKYNEDLARKMGIEILGKEEIRKLKEYQGHKLLLWE